MISRTTVAYTSILYILDWVTIGLLAYHIRGAARFVVSTGSILTIRVVVPTALISMKLLQ